MHHFRVIISSVMNALKQLRPSSAYSRAKSSSISPKWLRQGVMSIWMHCMNLQPPNRAVAGMYFMRTFLRRVPDVRAIALFRCNITVEKQMARVGINNMGQNDLLSFCLICEEGSVMQGEFLSLSEPFSLIISSSRMDCFWKRSWKRRKRCSELFASVINADQQQSLWRSSNIAISVENINQQFGFYLPLHNGFAYEEQSELGSIEAWVLRIGTLNPIISISISRMANKGYTRVELKALLEGTQQEVRFKLLDPLGHNNQFFYQNFAAISLKALKYVNHFLNLINSDQQIGNTIDAIFKNLNESLNDYKGRNIFAHSTFSQESDLHHNEDDQIYHFLNTRNNHIPAQCLNNYEGERQRNELEQFLQEMSKNSKTNQKQPKRSLILPKENTFKLKMGRKATFDTELRSIEEEMVESKTYAPLLQPQSQKTCIHKQIQTDFAIRIADEENRIKTADLDVESQCESIPIFEHTLENLSNRKLKAQSSKKKGSSKKKVEKDASKGKKKWKASNSPSCISFKQSMQILNEHEQQQKQQEKDSFKAAQCSIKSVNPFLTITKQLDLAYTSGGIVDKFQICNHNLTTFNREQTISNANIPSYISQSKQEKVEQNKLYLDNEKSQKFNQSMYESSSKKQASETEMRIQWSGALQDVQNSLQLGYITKFEVKDSINCNEPKVDVFGENEQRAHISYSQSAKMTTSTIKVIQEDQLQQKGIKEYTSSTSQYHARGDIKNSKKRKIYTNSNRSFQPIDLEGQKQNKNFIQNIKKSNFQNASPVEAMGHTKKQSWRLSSVQPIAGKHDVSAVSSVASQDYLISRQKKSMNIKNKLSQIMRNGVKDDDRHGKLQELIDGNKRLKAIRGNPMNSLNLSRQSSLNTKKSVQPDKRSMMIFFSSKPKESSMIPQEANSKVDDNVSAPKKQSSQMNIFDHMRKMGKMEGSIIDQASKTPQVTPNLSQDLSILKRYREKQCKTMEAVMGSPKRSLFYHKSTDMTPVKASISIIRQEMRHLNTSQSHKKVVHSSSEHRNSESLEFHDLKRKLRNRVYKDKLSQYLELIQTTHLKFCGKDCQHLSELFKGQGGSVPEQILRLFKKLK